MAKTKISDFNSNPALNTDIDSINLAEGCAPSGINDAIRELMAQLKDFQTGAVGDSFNGPVGTTTAATGAFTTLTTTGTINNLTVGRGAGAVSTNTAVGASALNANTSGAYNTATGANALLANTSGAGNTSFGIATLAANTTGGENTAIGGSSATSPALRLNTTGSYNIAVGAGALSSNTTASNNTAVGYQAMYTTTTGATNTTLGYQAGYSIGTGSNNVCVGRADVSVQNVTHEITIATAGVGGKGANTGFISPNGGAVYQGNNGATWSVTSDQRLKKNIVNNNTGLGIINQIQVRNFEYRLPEEITEVPQSQAIKKQGVQLGVIAQELQQVLPECVKTESTGVMSVDTDNLVWYLINAVKELKAEIETLKGN